jgi:3-phenylpropionate/trans-cinnamate dioxygenase ferredoxin reductase component
VTGVVIVGAGHGGVQLAASLTDSGFSGDVVLLDAQNWLPYQRPPLSKQYLVGNHADDDLLLRPPSFYASRGIDLRLGVRATEIDRNRRVVRTDTSVELPYQQLILAQGAANRELLLPGAHLNGIFALRTLSQVKGFRARLAAAENVVVIGGGFIGMEVAATASRTAAVTIIEQQERVLARAVAPLMSQAVESTHRNAGNDLRTGESVKELRGRDGHVTDVILGDGTAIPADVVVIGVGALPHTDIAARAGLEIANGILVDDRLRTNDPAIYAIGDCAARINRRNDTPQRLECVQNSVDQARHVAAQIVSGSAEPYNAVPYFWTNQFDLRIQTVGLGTRDDEFVVLGDPLQRAFSICRFSHGELVAVESLNRPRDHVAARKILNAALSLTPEVALLKGFDLNEHLTAGQRASPPIGAAC